MFRVRYFCSWKFSLNCGNDRGVLRLSGASRQSISCVSGIRDRIFSGALFHEVRFRKFFFAAVVSLAIDDDSPLGRTFRNFGFALPTDRVHPKLSEQQCLLPSRECAEGSVLNGAVLRLLEKATSDMSERHSPSRPRARRRWRVYSRMARKALKQTNLKLDQHR